MPEEKTPKTHSFIPYKSPLKQRARELRREMTRSEKRLWYDCLRKLPVRILRQKPLGDYIVDFYCHEHKLVIEVDGESHYTDEGKKHDIVRTKKLEEMGFRIIRFTNFDIAQNFSGVCEAMTRELNLYQSD